MVEKAWGLTICKKRQCRRIIFKFKFDPEILVTETAFKQKMPRNIYKYLPNNHSYGNLNCLKTLKIDFSKSGIVLFLP